jgi:hypothetical protein
MIASGLDSCLCIPYTTLLSVILLRPSASSTQGLESIAMGKRRHWGSSSQPHAVASGRLMAKRTPTFKPPDGTYPDQLDCTRACMSPRTPCMWKKRRQDPSFQSIDRPYPVVEFLSPNSGAAYSPQSEAQPNHQTCSGGFRVDHLSIHPAFSSTW